MADEKPQASGTEVRRNPDGTVKPGGGSLNPGGQPRWLKEVRDQLNGLMPSAADYLGRIIRGEEQVSIATKDGGVVEVDVQPKDRIAAVKVLFEFTLPKPKQELELSGQVKTSPLAGMSREELLAIALGKPPEK